MADEPRPGVTRTVAIGGLCGALSMVAAGIAAIKVIDPSTSGAQLIELVKALIWPAFAIFAVLLFAAPLRNLVKRISSGEFDVTKGKFSFDTQAAAVTKTLEKAEQERKAEPGSEPSQESSESRMATASITPQVLSYDKIRSRINAETQTTFAASRILWVDNSPRHNQNEMDALRALGITIHVATSTEDALSVLRHQQYDLVISDMGRPGDADAGFSLALKIRERGLTVPVVIYTGARRVEELRGQAFSKGVWYVCSDPYELFAAVTNYLIQANAVPPRGNNV
jgi:DNA-binding NtrC family response regulator